MATSTTFSQWTLAPTEYTGGDNTRCFDIDTHAASEPPLEFFVGERAPNPEKTRFLKLHSLSPSDDATAVKRAGWQFHEPKRSVARQEGNVAWSAEWTEAFRSACIAASEELPSDIAGTPRAVHTNSSVFVKMQGVDVDFDGTHVSVYLKQGPDEEDDSDDSDDGCTDRPLWSTITVHDDGCTDRPLWSTITVHMAHPESHSLERGNAAVEAIQRAINRFQAPDFSTCSTGLDIWNQLAETLEKSTEALQTAAGRYTYRETYSAEEIRERKAAATAWKQQKQEELIQAGKRMRGELPEDHT